ncbi:DNA polymerase I [Solibacillus sp. FSL H8-0538]|uniref:DNA polymerase I n=1 Tax=Solibacillus sp. FSL H8-0538 TaxID=2921400 RepID=UPI0030F79498
MTHLSNWIQNTLLAFIMATSITALFNSTNFEWMKVGIFNISLLFIIMFGLSLFIAEDVRNSFKKVLWFEKRKDKLQIWQVGIGMIFYFTQVGFVEVFARILMKPELGGMPLYLVFAFMNAFLLTVIYQEIFYIEEKASVEEFKFKKLK